MGNTDETCHFMLRAWRPSICPSVSRHVGGLWSYSATKSGNGHMTD